MTVKTSSLSLDNYAQISSSTSGKGNSGRLLIQTDTLSLNNNSVIAASTTGQGNANKITLQAQNSISLNNGSVITSATGTRQGGKGGDIDIQSLRLFITNGSEISAFSRGQEDAGNINVIAPTEVNISDPDSGLFTLTQSNTGKGGRIAVDTNTFRIANKAALNASTTADSPGGSIAINANTFDATTGGQLLTTTSGKGRAGNITLNINDSSLFSGTNSGLFANTESLSSGDGGKIVLYTGTLELNDGAQLAATTAGEGNAGSVTIQANSTASFNNGSVLSSVESGAKGKGGNLSITTPSLLLTNGSQLQALTRGQGDAGNVTIEAIDTVSFDRSFALTSVESEAVGKGGNLTVTGREFSLTNGAQLSASTLGKGDAGNIQINAVNGAVNISGSNSGLLTKTESNDGKGGAIAIDTTTFRISDDAVLNATTNASSPGGSITVNANTFDATTGGQLLTTTSGKGRAGDITLNINDSSLFSGTNSGLFANTQTDSSGEGGKILVNTKTFQLSDSAMLDARTAGAGRGGNITVNTNTFDAANGGQLATTTSGSGRAGDITVNAIERFTLSGSETGLFASTTKDSTGDGGSIFIDPIQFAITDNAGIGVNSQGQGNGGNIQIQAGSVTLDRNAFLSAVTANGEGGNINLQVQGPSLSAPMLLMRHNSSISATAGNTGNGGNLNINAPFIIAVPGENSDITANAFQGRGGNIQISTQAIFGLEYRPSLTPLSDITASSDFGIDGEVVINTPGIDPSRGLTSLPSVPVNPQIVVGCQAGGSQASVGLFNVGRTGLPASPDDPLNEETIIADWINPDVEAGNSSPGTTTTNLPKSVTNSGAAAMTTQVPTVTPPCHAY
ncbi:hypothetical protein NIES4074_61750 (plasmid) [Cylindrospermum sp. NIES-4074]|nr:hypothetical protein NIES4074_61750 [Cylindrospermum sp. NIES-4074]